MDIDVIVKTLKEDGKVIAINTDTVYGLVCNAFDKNASNKIYKIKNREKNKPLSIFVKSIDDVTKYIDDKYLNDEICGIMEKYWPGELTIIFKKKDDTFNHITDGVSGIGIRIPNNKTLLDILNKVDFPLAQTSCNISGEKEYRDADEIKTKIGKDIDMIVDGGTIACGTPSTVISFIDGNINVIRLGNVKLDDSK